MVVAKWGNSLAVRLPAAIVEVLQLKEGEEIEITVVSGRAFEVARKPSNLELLKRLQKYRGTIPKGFKFNRDECYDR